jgi:hypothetical protein
VSTKAKSRRGRGRGQVVSGYPRPVRLNLPAAGARPSGGRLPDPIPEAALYPAVANWLTDQGYKCWRDVSYLGRWIDLFAEHPDGKTVAVELKVTDWKRGMRQAQVVRPAATQTFLGIWAPYVHRAQSSDALAELRGMGIGLLAVNGKCSVLKESPSGPARYGRWVKKPARISHRPSP